MPRLASTATRKSATPERIRRAGSTLFITGANGKRDFTVELTPSGGIHWTARTP